MLISAISMIKEPRIKMTTGKAKTPTLSFNDTDNTKKKRRVSPRSKIGSMSSSRSDSKNNSLPRNMATAMRTPMVGLSFPAPLPSSFCLFCDMILTFLSLPTVLIEVAGSDCAGYFCSETGICVDQPILCPCLSNFDRKVLTGDWYICLRGPSSHHGR